MQARVNRDPIIRHSYIQINDSLVHLCQYGVYDTLLRHPSTWPAKKPPPPPAASELVPGLLLPRAPARAVPETAIVSGRPPKIYSKLDNQGAGGSSDIINSIADIPTPIKIIVFVPGNPGVLGVYHDFLMKLFRQVMSVSYDSRSLPTIFAMGHNNFDHTDHVNYKVEERIRVEEGDMNFVEREIAKCFAHDPHHIELQVLNKLIILKRLLKVPLEDCKIIFIGHSIGCYVILKILQDKLIQDIHEGSIMFHPALENLALTRKGFRFNLMFNLKLDLLGQSLVFMIDNFLPRRAKVYLAKLLCSEEFVNSASSTAIQSVAQLACFKTFRALIGMAKSEFKLVKNINLESMIEPNVDKLRLIYAENDGWVNRDSIMMLQRLYPNLYMEEKKALHAFMLDPKLVHEYSVKAGLMIGNMYDKYFEKNSSSSSSSNTNTSTSNSNESTSRDSNSSG